MTFDTLSVCTMLSTYFTRPSMFWHVLQNAGNTGCGFYCERGCHHPSLVLHLLESKSSVYISLDRVMMVTLPAVELRAEPCQTFARVIHQPASPQLPTDNFLFL